MAAAPAFETPPNTFAAVPTALPVKMILVEYPIPFPTFLTPLYSVGFRSLYAFISAHAADVSIHSSTFDSAHLFSTFALVSAIAFSNDSLPPNNHDPAAPKVPKPIVIRSAPVSKNSIPPSKRPKPNVLTFVQGAISALTPNISKASPRSVLTPARNVGNFSFETPNPNLAHSSSVTEARNESIYCCPSLYFIIVTCSCLILSASLSHAVLHSSI